MFRLNFLPHFKRKLKKLTRRDTALVKQFDTTLKQLAEDPTNPQLKSHKVTHRSGREAFSSKVTNDLRLIWLYSSDKVDVTDVIDTGGHSGGKKVYR